MTDITEILRGVPEVNLRIIPLTWELLDKDGRIDVKKAAYKTKEVEAALDEAEGYMETTKNAVSHLKNLIRQ